MKAAKYILILLLILLVTGSIYFSVKDGSYSFSRSTELNVPAELVAEQLHSPEFVAKLLDENAPDLTINQDANRIEYADGSVTGTIELQKILDQNAQEIVVRHNGLLTSDTASGLLTVQPTPTGSKVTVTLGGEQSFKEKLGAVLDGNNLRDTLEELFAEDNLLLTESGSQIQQEVKKSMEVRTFSPNGMVELSGGYYLYLTTESKTSQLESTYQQLAGEIRTYMEKNQINSYGEPTQFFLEGDPSASRSRIAVGIPVRERIIIGDDTNITSYYLEPHTAVKSTLKGDRTYIAESFKEAQKYQRSLGTTGAELPAYLIYKNRRADTPNPAHLITEIYLPVE